MKTSKTETKINKSGKAVKKELVGISTREHAGLLGPGTVLLKDIPREVKKEQEAKKNTALAVSAGAISKPVLQKANVKPIAKIAKVVKK